MNIVILAAGQGKRMRSTLPKVLHPLAGRAMLAHVLTTARQTAGAAGQRARIVVVIGHGAEKLRAWAAAQPDLDDLGDDLCWAVQSPQLGTGHAVAQAAPQLDDSAATLILYGDVPLVRSETLARLIDAAAGGVGVLTARMADPTGYGRIVRDGAGSVRRIVEERDATATERAIDEINTGILVVPTARLTTWLAALRNDNAQGEYYLTDVIAQAVAAGVTVTACTTQAEETRGVNSPAELAAAERVAQRRAADALLAAGVRLADPARIDVRGRVTAGADVFIDVGCVFEGEVVIGDGVQIGPYTVMRDVTIGAATEVFAFSHLVETTIGANARIGPYARTRPGARLDDEVHIGNFVEVKASHLGRGAKANHLTYVGDATVGARTNIGAGTIVANYDGVNKHKSEIGADVSIGSNVVLVAPITVGAGATVGAGSTVANQVPAGKLTVARARAVTIDGWQRPVKLKGKPVA